jgi:hypothetical protein
MKLQNDEFVPSSNKVELDEEEEQDLVNLYENIEKIIIL